MIPSIRRVVIINDFSEARGGATGLALLAAGLLRKRGLHVTFISGDAGPREGMRMNGVEHIALGGSRLSPQGSSLQGLVGLWNLSHRRRLEALVAQLDTPDTVYHVHSWQKILTPAVFAALRPVRPRLLVHAHDFFLACPNGAFTDYPRGAVCEAKPLSGRCLSRSCDRRRQVHKAYRVVRQVVQNRATGLPGDGADILLIHPAMRGFLVRADIPQDRMFTVLNPATALTAERVEAERNSVFFFVGRVEPEKGVYEFARAVRKAGVEACIVGEGTSAAFIRSEFPEIRLEGWRSHSELSSLVKAARCLVMPSRCIEPYGLVAAEAAQSGIPVVASKHALLAEELVRLGMGIALESLEESGFATVLARLARDHEMIARMSRNGFARASSIASTPEHWCDELIGHYHRVLLRAHQPAQVAL